MIPPLARESAHQAGMNHLPLGASHAAAEAALGSCAGRIGLCGIALAFFLGYPSVSV